MQEGDRHWSLLLIKYSMVVMETVIWSGGGGRFFSVVQEQHELGVFPHPLP